MSISTATGSYISPVLATLSASASKSVNYEVLQQEVVTIADISQTFTVTLTDASSVAILNAFSVSDVDASDGTDASANADVSFNSTDDFVAAIKYALQNSVNGTGVDISGYLFGAGTGNVDARLNTEIKRVFMNDNFPNILATFARNSLVLNVDYSGGATNMTNNIAAANDNTRRYFLTQLPTQNVRAYQVDASADVVNDLGFLPLLKGDKLTFVWDATVSLSASTAAGQPTQNDGTTGLSNPVSDSASNRVDLSNIGTTSYAALSSVTRRIAVEIKLGAGGTKWTVTNGKLTA
ncbi:MAG: hypothetical protein EBT86_03965 [Actinobacteria bacterium]|nr:hypothetical protein [Actinomycetota bacterium]